MESCKDGKGSSDPKIHLDQELLIALTKSAIYHMERVGQEYDIWAEKSVKKFGSYVEPYLYPAWKQAEQMKHGMPISETGKVRKEEDGNETVLFSKGNVKKYGSKLLFTFLTIFIWASMFYGMFKLGHKIIPDWVAYKENRVSGYEEDLVAVIAFLLSLVCFKFLHMGYKFYQAGHWGDFLLPGKRMSQVIDRDELIYKLEKIFHLSKKIDEVRKIREGHKYSDDELDEINNQLLSVIELKEKNMVRKKNISGIHEEAIESINLLNGSMPVTKKEVEVCSLTNQECDYYDSKDDACYYGKEGVEFWRNKMCPKKSLNS
jgi:hypothetical protein